MLTFFLPQQAEHFSSRCRPFEESLLTLYQDRLRACTALGLFTVRDRASKQGRGEANTFYGNDIFTQGSG